MHPRHGIRANLCANREQRTRFVDTIRQQSFGIYWNVSDHTAAALHDISRAAVAEAKIMLKEERPKIAEFNMQDAFAATFLTQREVSRAMRRGLLQRNFSLNTLLQVAGETSVFTPQQVEVPVGRPEWGEGRGIRNLVVPFIPSEADEQLAGHMEVVTGALEAASVTDVSVRIPNHVTLFRYGCNGDGQELSYRHMEEIIDIVDRQFSAADIGSVMLDEVVIGKSYQQPMRLAA